KRWSAERLHRVAWVGSVLAWGRSRIKRATPVARLSAGKCTSAQCDLGLYKERTVPNDTKNHYDYYKYKE
ncbi:MAG: hypothetical protein K2K83_02935, partial [Rikenella sp.]|nr:hypothetical protein [Rikenella sp.]